MAETKTCFWFQFPFCYRLPRKCFSCSFRKNGLSQFSESLGGSQAPPSFWRVPGLPWKFPELPRKFFGNFPGASLTVDFNAIQRFPGSSQNFPGSSPNFPGNSPDFPGSFRDFPGGQPLSLGSLTSSPDSQKTFSEKNGLSFLVQFGLEQGVGVFWPILRYYCSSSSII